MAVGGLAAAFGCMVIAGYLVPWAWTGFVGNTLWDWLHLLLLPLLVPAAIVPVLRTALDERLSAGVAAQEEAEEQAEEDVGVKPT